MTLRFNFKWAGLNTAKVIHDTVIRALRAGATKEGVRARDFPPVVDPLAAILADHP